jgi:hypothetical protein
LDIKSIFGRAVDARSPAERSAYLDEACGGDAALRADVESLLKAQDEAPGFLHGPSPSQIATADDPITERVAQPGTVIGPYKLLEQIGEGASASSSWPSNRSRSAVGWL